MAQSGSNPLGCLLALHSVEDQSKACSEALVPIHSFCSEDPDALVIVEDLFFQDVLHNLRVRNHLSIAVLLLSCRVMSLIKWPPKPLTSLHQELDPKLKKLAWSCLNLKFQTDSKLYKYKQTNCPQGRGCSRTPVRSNPSPHSFWPGKPRPFFPQLR